MQNLSKALDRFTYKLFVLPYDDLGLKYTFFIHDPYNTNAYLEYSKLTLFWVGFLNLVFRWRGRKTAPLPPTLTLV